jgi:hypothetical protein
VGLAGERRELLAEASDQDWFQNRRVAWPGSCPRSAVRRRLGPRTGASVRPEAAARSVPPAERRAKRVSFAGEPTAARRYSVLMIASEAVPYAKTGGLADAQARCRWRCPTTRGT